MQHVKHEKQWLMMFTKRGTQLLAKLAKVIMVQNGGRITFNGQPEIANNGQ